jgi:ligand-binding SRPBCC domain-containing protein
MNIQAKHAPREKQDSMRIVCSPTRRGYRLQASQFLPYPRYQVFEFFSDASNLQSLTPAWLHFSVVNPPPICIAAGTLIDYRLRVHVVPLRWQSRISVWEPPLRFVDEQTRGPYRLWQHEHLFEAAEGGTLCHDIVDYDVYGGSLMNALFVRPDLFKIFAFRQSKLRELFPETGALTSRLNQG